MMKDSSNSRREALQQIGLMTAGMFMFSLGACTDDKKANENPADIKAPLPFLISPKESMELGAIGSNMRTLIRSAQTNGQFSCVEAILGPKKIAGSPHKHDHLDELMYVLEGTASVLMGEEVIEVAAGSWHLRPRGIVHVVWNSGNENLRLIDMYFNQNFEDYLEEVYHKIIPEVMQKNLSFETPEIAKRIAELDKKFGLTYYPEKQQPLIDKYGLS